jgi:hypothetical protein
MIPVLEQAKTFDDLDIAATVIGIIKSRIYKICLRERVFVANTSVYLQTTLAADAHLAEGRFILEEQTNLDKSVMSSRTSETNSFQNKSALFRTKLKLSKEQCIEVIPPLL